MATDVKEARSAEQAEEEDLFFGQSVIIWARWSVIVAGIVLAIWTGLVANSVNQLVATTPFFFALMAMNFFLHGRYVMGSPLNRTVVIATSLVDLAVITAIVVLWPGRHGLDNQFFVLYYPVVFAFALVFPRGIESIYTALAIAVYAAACFATSSGELVGRLISQHDSSSLKVLVMRAVVIAAMGFLGNFYFRIERDRLRRAAQGGPSALEDLQAKLQPVPARRRRR
jgi:hypothetical protein